MKKIPIQYRLNESFQNHGNRIAIECGNKKITYSELGKRADCIFNWIIRSEISPGNFIGICIDDRVDLTAGIIGILRARCTFVILDPVLPPGRIEKMIRVAHPPIIFLDEKNIILLTQSEFH